MLYPVLTAEHGIPERGLIRLRMHLCWYRLKAMQGRRQVTSESTSPAVMCSSCAASRAPLASNARTPCADRNKALFDCTFAAEQE